jgi:endonuclease I
MIRYTSFILLYVEMVSRIFAGNTVSSLNVVRHTIIHDNKMPSIYIEKHFHVDESLKQNIYSMEHIFPCSHLNKKDQHDMHNVIRTLNDLNVNRSNYKYTDILTSDKNWIKLDFDNYVNHKHRLFIPNNVSRGFISRAILYMSKEYHYNPLKIIDKDTLIKWFYDYPPKQCEKYHNEMIKKLQNKNNIFISNYNKKSKIIHKFLEDI